MFMKQVNFISPEPRSEWAATARILEAAREKNHDTLGRMFRHPESYGVPVVNIASAKT